MAIQQTSPYIYFESVETPLLVFNSDQISDLVCNNSFDVIGNELSSDTLEFTVFYEDNSNVLRNMEYATIIFCYNGEAENNQFIGKYYFTSVERQGVGKWLVRATSLIGLIEKENFYGGYYSNESFENILSDILFTDGIIKGGRYTAYTPVRSSSRQGVLLEPDLIGSKIAKYRLRVKFTIIDAGSSSDDFYYFQYVAGRMPSNYFVELYAKKDSNKPVYFAPRVWYIKDNQYGHVELFPGYNDNMKGKIGAGSTVTAEINPMGGYASILIDYVLPGESEVSGHYEVKAEIDKAECTFTNFALDTAFGVHLESATYTTQAHLQWHEHKVWDEKNNLVMDAVFAKNSAGNYVVVNAAKSGSAAVATSNFVAYGDALGYFRNTERVWRDVYLSDSISFSDTVKTLKVYGWIEVGSRRDALHKLLFSQNVSMIKSADGGILFTELEYDNQHQIDALDLYDDSTESNIYGAKIIGVTEHSYASISGNSVVIFDNSSSSLTDGEYIAIFNNAPIDGTVVGNGITIKNYNCNAAIVTGRGTITGKPYIHSTSERKYVNSKILDGIDVSVSDVGLITGINADNVMAKLKNYYSGNLKKIINSIVFRDYRCGLFYVFKNLFEEENRCFLTKFSAVASSFIKSLCEFVSGYQPAEVGGYTEYNVFVSSNSWVVPTIIRQKTSPTIRLTLIGKGSNGTDGANGEDGTLAQEGTGLNNRSPGEGGKGGKGGKGGSGGKIYGVTINVANVNRIEISESGDNIIVQTYDDNSTLINSYSSASGNISENGFVNIFTGDVYALPGEDGLDGGDGGRGGACKITQYESGIGITVGVSESGVDVADWRGGRGQNGRLSQKYFGDGAWSRADNNYSGGGGAAYGSNGTTDSFDESLSTYDYFLSTGGNGANASSPNAKTLYGTGGYGGHGGGGGGGAGNVFFSTRWNGSETLYYVTISNTAGAGGNGSAGTSGIQGCAIVYY